MAHSGGPGDLRLTRPERVGLVALYAGILGVTVAAFVAAFAFLPHHYSGEVTGGGLLFSGLAISAYILGVRHGFDADHIAAIDNTTRKLLNDGQRPLTVGTWFSLGHSTVVAAMIAGLVVATQFVATYYRSFLAVGTILGTLVSATFLIVIGLINVVIVADVYRIFRGLRTRAITAADLDREMEQRGFLYRYFGRLFGVVTTPRQIYPIGLLFGLGFDTATEVLIISFAVTVGLNVPLWSVMILPLLFTCGMVLADTTDGVSMRYAYGWAFLRPIRKVYYNLTLTVISVLVAFAIGGIELLGVLSGELGWSGPFWSALDGLSFESLGIGIALLFVASWLVAMGIYRLKRFEEAGVAPPAPPAPGSG